MLRSDPYTFMIHIYTGNGKGKTTAAVGQAMRAAGQGLRVAWIQYCKDITAEPSGEIKMLKTIGVKCYEFAPQIPFFNRRIKHSVVKKECTRSFALIKKIFKKLLFDVVVLDEVNVALSNKFLSLATICTILKKKPASIEIIITGRGKHKKLYALADLITEMKEIKHPFNKGIKARKGIEY